ncbi:hypothetical protein D3C85_481820 [compost metagenome]
MHGLETARRFYQYGLGIHLLRIAALADQNHAPVAPILLQRPRHMKFIPSDLVFLSLIHVFRLQT